MKRISCKPKALPHYFGRGIHAIDVLDYAKNEGTLQVISMSTHFWNGESEWQANENGQVYFNLVSQK